MAERFTKYQTLHRPLFPRAEQSDLVVVDENVRHLIPSASLSDRQYVGRYYAQRGMCFPKLSNDSNARVGLLVAHSSADIRAAVNGQLDYFNEVTGNNFQPISPQNIYDARNPYVVPYLNPTREEIEMRRLGAEVFGMPGRVTDLLNNKSSARALVEEYNSPDFRFVKNRSIEVDEVAKEAPRFLQEIVNDYDERGFRNSATNSQAQHTHSLHDDSLLVVQNYMQRYLFLPRILCLHFHES